MATSTIEGQRGVSSPERQQWLVEQIKDWGPQQRREGKRCPSECRAPNNSKER